MKDKKNIVYFGTPQFSAVFLEKLINDGFFISTVVTAPDKKFGRKQELKPSAVKEVTNAHKIDILQPRAIRNNADFLTEFKNINPDLAIVVAYGKILPQEILDIPKLGFINVHPSKLPQYRGPSPMQWSLLNGDTKSAITIMQLDAGMDTGDILFQKDFSIESTWHYKDLEKFCAEEGSVFLSKYLPDILNSNTSPQKQDDQNASYSKMISREDGKIIDFSSAKNIENMGKAYFPWPGLFMLVDGMRLKIELPKAFILDFPGKSSPGSLVQIDSDTCAILCDDGYIIPSSFQPEGKRRLSNSEFLSGYQHMITKL